MFASVMDHLRWSWIIELLFQFIHLISLQNHSHLGISLSLRIRKMLQIIVKHLSTSLLNTEKKLWKLSLHKDFLTIYKNHKRQPKGFNIKFNLSWRANNKHLQRFCKSILNKTSRNILKKSYQSCQHWYTPLEKKTETVEDWIILFCYTMSLKQRARGLRRKWMVSKELSDKDTPENFQGIR